MSSSGQKVVLITGASSGIGEATAIEFAKLGYRLVITGRDKTRLDNVLQQLILNSPSKSSDNFLSLIADFELPDEVEPIVGKTLDKFGRLDILVNNAGYSGKKRELEDPEFYEDFKAIMQVNLFAATRLVHLAAPHLVESKGIVINVSSIADRIAMPTISYSVSKAALTMLTRSLANAFDGFGVRCLTVSPGPIITNFAEGIEEFGKMTSLQRSGNSKEVAETILYLCSEKASYIHGCSIDVDGGCYSKFAGVFSHKNKFNKEQ